MSITYERGSTANAIQWHISRGAGTWCGKMFKAPIVERHGTPANVCAKCAAAFHAFVNDERSWGEDMDGTG